MGEIVSGIGSVIGSVGGAIGGAAGDVFGGLTGHADSTGPGFDINQYANRDDQSATRKQQEDFIAALQARANGTGGASPAELMLQKQAQQSQAMMMGQAAAARGINPALALRNAQLMGARSQQDTNANASILRAQEQIATQGLLGQTLAGVRGQDITNTNNYNQLGLGYAQGQNAVAQSNAANKQKFYGSVMGAAGSGMAGGGGGGGGASGGVDPALAENGAMLAAAQGGQVPEVGPSSFVGKHLTMAKGGKVPALVSPGERYLSPKEAEKVADGKKHAMKAGEKIPGKPAVKGAVNSYDNDTVKKDLESGGVVVPRSVTQASHSKEKADAFVKAVLSHKAKK